MTKRDVIGVMAVLETAYPSYYAKQGEQQRREAVNLWADLFAEDMPELVAAAVKAIIVSDPNPFPPSIGQIKNKMQSILNPDELTEAEAWALVAKACRNGFYGSKEEFAKLPPAVQDTIGSPNQLREWSMMDESTLQSVVASNFQRGYRTICQRRREYSSLPEAVRLLLDKPNNT